MQFPKKALFAFNAVVDHVIYADEAVLAKIEGDYPVIAQQISESFAWGVEKEITIDGKTSEWMRANFKPDLKVIGGQAGNAAEQASALGVECLLHTNSANDELLSLFSHREKIFVAGEEGFVQASKFTSQTASARHFVFESRESKTRFIASYDPTPLHLDDNFSRHILAEIPVIEKAFIGGLHLAKTPDRLRKFLSEMKKWKEINPKLKLFFEMGQFQSREALKTAEEELFPFVDMVGLTDSELAQLGTEMDSLPSAGKSFLFHSPNEQLVLPHEKQNAAALEFARRCASFFAENGRRATEQELVGYEPKSVESPKRTVGLGDTFSCAYFLAAD